MLTVGMDARNTPSSDDDHRNPLLRQRSRPKRASSTALTTTERRVGDEWATRDVQKKRQRRASPCSQRWCRKDCAWEWKRAESSPHRWGAAPHTARLPNSGRGREGGKVGGRGAGCEGRGGDVGTAAGDLQPRPRCEMRAAPLCGDRSCGWWPPPCAVLRHCQCGHGDGDGDGGGKSPWPVDARGMAATCALLARLLRGRAIHARDARHRARRSCARHRP